MQRRYLIAVLTVLIVVLRPVLAFGQQTFGPAPAPDPNNPMPSIWGTTGLWKVIAAETPPAHSSGIRRLDRPHQSQPRPTDDYADRHQPLLLSDK